MTPPSPALPWSSADPKRLAGVVGVLTDIDDTLTTDGAIPMGVVAALAALLAAGLPTIAVTGRPMGWSRPIARETPLAAVVAENGGVALIHDGDDVLIEYAAPKRRPCVVSVSSMSVRTPRMRTRSPTGNSARGFNVRSS